MTLNIRSILKIYGVLIFFESLFLSIPFLYSLITQDGEVWAFMITIIIALVIALPLWIMNRHNTRLLRRDVYLIVTGSWVLVSFIGMLPYLLGSTALTLTDAFFETVSGFTTTGASIFLNVDVVSPSLLLWRSLTQWVGGGGIIVLMVAIIPILGIGGMQLFSAESSGVSIDRIRPRIKETAIIMWIVYATFTGVAFVLLMIAGLSIFDALNHAMTTLATGGFSTKQASVAAFSPTVQYIIAFFMFLAGINFVMLYAGLRGKIRSFWKSEEFRFYVGYVSIAVALVTVYLILSGGAVEVSFRNALFQIVSIVSTTGFVTYDYLQWGDPALYLLFLLMFFGGMTGSSAGGIKAMRLLILLKGSILEFRKQLHPDAILPLRFSGARVQDSIYYHVMAFALLYILIAVLSTLVLLVCGVSIPGSAGAVVTSLGGIGPGFGEVGPIETFTYLPAFVKWFLSFLMIVGRLELFTVLILFMSYYWKRF